MKVYILRPFCRIQRSNRSSTAVVGGQSRILFCHECVDDADSNYSLTDLNKYVRLLQCN